MRDSGVRVSSLFWEAESCETSKSRVMPGTAFDPRGSSMNSNNAILFDFNDCVRYLENQLRALGLSDTAATDFMQYWIPNFTAIRENGQKIAIRFIPQPELEAEARLVVTPKPDAVTRIFMLFKGINREDWHKWQGVTEKKFNWRNVIGIDNAVPSPDRFEVIEWGGMQLY